MTGWLRRYALSRSIIDIPNARSSHALPTPRGGGMSIVVTFLLALPVLAAIDLMEWPLAWALIGAGSGIALLGFLDDHGHIAARWRLLGHFTGAVWVLFCLDGWPPLQFFGHDIALGWISNLVGLFYIVWLLNLYNFMDGIDGLASIEAICVCLGGSLLYILSGYDQEIWAPLALACASAGFLFWNFPPAKIFMGDAGSGFLGLALAALSLHAGWINSDLFFGWLVLLGVFVVDATLTLLRRIRRGEKVYEAHRSHAYQFASRHYGRHLPVTVSVLVINIVWLIPIASAVVTGMVDGSVGVLIAYIPLVCLAVKFNAGQAEDR